MRDILKLTLELTLIAAISAGLLAFVSTRTKPARDRAAETKRRDAVRKVLHIAEGESFRYDEARDVFLVEKKRLSRNSRALAETVPIAAPATPRFGKPSLPKIRM